jgi:hypothetical protein
MVKPKQSTIYNLLFTISIAMPNVDKAIGKNNGKSEQKPVIRGLSIEN